MHLIRFPLGLRRSASDPGGGDLQAGSVMENVLAWLQQAGSSLDVLSLTQPTSCRRKLHYRDFLWISRTTSCTINPQQIAVMEFALNTREEMGRKRGRH